MMINGASLSYSLMILMFTPCILAGVPNVKLMKNDTLGSCQCAAFKLCDTVKKEPLVMKNTEIEMADNEENNTECKELCVALAEANKEAPKVLCEAIKTDIDFLKVAVNYRIAGDAWIFTGKTNSIPICCRTGSSVPCEKFETLSTKI